MAKSSTNPSATLISSLLLLALCFRFCSSSASASASSSPAASSSYPTDFIRSSCAATRYPFLCVQSLASYAPAVRRSPRELARFALAVSADRARSAASRLAAAAAAAGPARPGPVRDCLETMADGVDRLRDAAAELGRAGRSGSAGFAWHLSNVRTWCSAALTDEGTCLDGVDARGRVDPATRAAVRKEVVAVAQFTSNALALLNRLGHPAGMS